MNTSTVLGARTCRRCGHHDHEVKLTPGKYHFSPRGIPAPRVVCSWSGVKATTRAANEVDVTRLTPPDSAQSPTNQPTGATNRRNLSYFPTTARCRGNGNVGLGIVCLVRQKIPSIVICSAGMGPIAAVLRGPTRAWWCVTLVQGQSGTSCQLPSTSSTVCLHERNEARR